MLAHSPCALAEGPVLSHAELVDELRGINASLREAQARLDVDMAVDASEVIEVLNRAQVAFFEEDHPRAAIMLMRLTQRPRFKRHAAYGEALAYLAESLWALGLRDAAVEAFREALRVPKVLPTAYRRMLGRYLALAGEVEQLGDIRDYWRRYQTLRRQTSSTSAELDEADREVRYQYAKALFRGGALSEAQTLFDSVEEGDPHHLKALYFVAVIELKREEVLKAQAAFEAALEAWERVERPKVEAEPLYLDDADLDGDEREIVDLELEEEALLGDEARRAHERMGAVIHLALARMAAVREDDRAAWYHYRRVPRGDPDFAKALSEATYVLFRRGQYSWCVRLIDQLLAGRGDDVSAAQLSLWKAQLLARDAAYEDARASYQQMDDALKRRAEELESEAERSKRVFPQAVLAWSAPDDAQQANALEAELVTQEEDLAEIEEIIADLRAVQQAGGPLPAVERARAVKAALDTRLQTFAAHRQAAAEARAEGTTHSAIGEPLPTEQQLAGLAESARRLRARVTRFERQVATFDSTWRAKVAEAISAEAPKIAGLSSALGGERRAAERLAGAMRVTARQNLDNYAAEALFGQVDIAWWRKEEISRKINAAHRLRADQLEPLEASKRYVETVKQTLPPDPRYDLEDKAPLEAPPSEEAPPVPPAETPPAEDDEENAPPEAPPAEASAPVAGGG